MGCTRSRSSRATRAFSTASSSCSAALSSSPISARKIAATGIKNPNDQFVSLLKSDAVANVLISRFGLMERYESEMLTDARKHQISAGSV